MADSVLQIKQVLREWYTNIRTHALFCYATFWLANSGIFERLVTSVALIELHVSLLHLHSLSASIHDCMMLTTIENASLHHTSSTRLVTGVGKNILLLNAFLNFNFCD